MLWWGHKTLTSSEATIYGKLVDMGNIGWQSKFIIGHRSKIIATLANTFEGDYKSKPRNQKTQELPQRQEVSVELFGSLWFMICFNIKSIIIQSEEDVVEPKCGSHGIYTLVRQYQLGLSIFIRSRRAWFLTNSVSSSNNTSRTILPRTKKDIPWSLHNTINTISSVLKMNTQEEASSGSSDTGSIPTVDYGVSYSITSLSVYHAAGHIQIWCSIILYWLCL